MRIIKNKYKNIPTIIDNVRFQSKKEAKRYRELKELHNERLISELELQKKFELIPAQYEAFQIQGKRKTLERKRCVEKACTYIADFAYIDNEGNQIVEDTKGFRTPDYIIKRKLMLSLHNIKIVEI